MDTVSDTTRFLIANSLSKSTKHQYWSIFLSFKLFIINAFPGETYLPILLSHLLEFISFKYRAGNAYSTIRSAVSALAFIQKSLGFQDITNNFLVQKALMGVQKLRPSKDIRDPITFSMLTEMVNKIDFSIEDIYTRSLLRCMFFLAFRAFLRISKITYEHSSSKTNHCIYLSNIKINHQDRTLELLFNSYKHKKGDKPFCLIIKGDGSHCCPVRLMAEYLYHRKFAPGPLFIQSNMQPVDRKYFNEKLNFILKVCGFDQNKLHIRSHSFRIGAATHAIQKGYTNEQVEIMGRWRSQAFKRYIRVSSFTNN